MSTLTPEAKQLLSTTIRALRERLLKDLHDEAERRYRLAVPLAEAGLDEAHRRRRERLSAWLDERVRAAKPKKGREEQEARERLQRQAEKEAAATLLNRLVLVRHLEALGLSKPAVVTGGWNSKGYREFREFAPGLSHDPTEGYFTLLQLVFDDLAVDLPGLFGDVGLTRLFVVPPATLREVVERLDDPRLASAWTDDTTLGWVYQYWNDPERESLDAKLNDGGKIEPHEIASKTQMFTERYMVEWLLQNSLGLTWLSMCKKHGWVADAESVLPGLDSRRAEWRQKRERGEVALDALMPIVGELEERWKYYVPQPIPDDAVEKAPESIRAIKVLDPACGSGHFLVIAFDLLAALYREEARHRGTTIGDREIAESILENNLHGIDIDPRAVQIAAAGLYLKARGLAKESRPKRVNLVAPALQLASLPADDPALVQLKRELAVEAGIPETLTNKLMASLAGVDHLGSLLKVDDAVEKAIQQAELELEEKGGRAQGDLFKGFAAQQVKLPLGQAKATVLEKIERFLAKRSRSGDLGLRLDGEQLAAGVRFVRMAKEGVYDLVVGNPPYQGTSRMANAGYVAQNYPRGKADLYAAFLERGLELARQGGMSAMVTMRGWMFVGQFTALREYLLSTTDTKLLADLGTGAFSSRSMDDIISTALTVCRRASPGTESLGVQASPLVDPRRDAGKPARREAALCCQDQLHQFDARALSGIQGTPIVYWWNSRLFEKYSEAPKVSDVCPAKFGVNTGNNGRYTRIWWEPSLNHIRVSRVFDGNVPSSGWIPFILGGKGRLWFEDLKQVICWDRAALEMKLDLERKFGPAGIKWKVCNSDWYFREGIAFAMIGATFGARAHRYPSVIGNMGSSVFPSVVQEALCAMNSSWSKLVLQSLNPGLHFEVGDVNRLALIPVDGADDIFRLISCAFNEEESARETSVEFRKPGPSPWEYAQSWAQRAVDRPAGEPLPPYEPVYEEAPPASFVSFSIGVALGRFGESGEGILDTAPDDSLPHGILFLSAATLDDSLKHPASTPIHAAWTRHGAALGEGDDLHTYLRKSFFDHHKKLYENRPIYFPLSSAKKSFVAIVSIHRWRDDTLQVLLADHLLPEKRRLEGEMEDLRKARIEKTTKARAERRFADVQKLLEELTTFVAAVSEIAEKGPPPPDSKTRPRETDARFVMDLDDGVMVNSAALWPLLAPQWKDPPKWWRELASSQGRKDYDWSHLAARYFPDRVREKCQKDPSLAVAHHCFWRLHPAKAYAWELRLQDEIRPDFTIDEPDSNEARARFLKDHPDKAADILAAEKKRRERKSLKDETESPNGPLFDRESEVEEEDADA